MSSQQESGTVLPEYIYFDEVGYVQDEVIDSTVDGPLSAASETPVPTDTERLRIATSIEDDSDGDVADNTAEIIKEPEQLVADLIAYKPYNDGDPYRTATQISAENNPGAVVDLNKITNTDELLIVTESRPLPQVYKVKFGENPNDPKAIIGVMESIGREDQTGWSRDGSLPVVQFGEPLPLPELRLNDGNILRPPTGGVINLIALHGAVPAGLRPNPDIYDLQDCDLFAFYEDQLGKAYERGLEKKAKLAASNQDLARTVIMNTDPGADDGDDGEPAKVPKPSAVPFRGPFIFNDPKPDTVVKPAKPKNDEVVYIDGKYIKEKLTNNFAAKAVKRLYNLAKRNKAGHTDSNKDSKLSLSKLKEGALNQAKKLFKEKNKQTGNKTATRPNTASLSPKELAERDERRKKLRKAAGAVALGGVVIAAGALTGVSHANISPHATHAAEAVPGTINLRAGIANGLHSLETALFHAAVQTKDHARYVRDAVKPVAFQGWHAPMVAKVKPMLPHAVKIGKYGGTVWGVAKAELGKHATNHQIWLRTAKLLKENHITWYGARFLSAAKEIIT